MNENLADNVTPQEAPVNDELLNTASERWMQELGAVVENLGYMLRKPTETRPFVYEARVDLLPVKNKSAKMVLKGFGEDTGLVAFVDGDGFIAQLRQAQSLLSSGKLKWYPDGYVPGNYAERLQQFLSGVHYRR